MIADIVAYRERESTDPETGAPGVLRDEWRIRDLGDFEPEMLYAAWGTDWRRYRPFATHALEHRYIRRGVEEPWKPSNAANSRREALEYVDSTAIAVDSELAEIQAARREVADAERARQEAARADRDAAEEREHHRKRSEDAFQRLAQSKDWLWAEQWRCFVAKHRSDEAMKARIQADRTLYDAMLAAETVPAKRKAIRAFLKSVSKGQP